MINSYCSSPGQGILNRKQAYLALLGSLISLGFAIVAGHQIDGHQ